MNFLSMPGNSLKGEITVPGDKSISHRAIMLGAIAEGVTQVNGFLQGDDCLATLTAFRAMGVSIEDTKDGALSIRGVGKYGLQAPHGVIDCGNSGTTIRLLSGLLAAQRFDTVLTGDASLKKRPMTRVSRPLQNMGAKIETDGGCPPIQIYGRQTLHGICYEMPEASAQVKSCILLAGLYATGKTQVVEPEPTRDHTELMLKAFSYPVTRVQNVITIDASHECQGTRIDVPGDLSSAAFFIVGAMITPGSQLLIRNVGINPTRTGIITILKKMGGNIVLHNVRQYGAEPVADIEVSYSDLRGIEIPEETVPLAIDEFPILFIAAACAKGTTQLRGAAELRVKESDRIGAMAEGLIKLGIDAQATPDGMIIQGGRIGGGEVNSYHDHRIAMAFSMAGVIASQPILIQHCDNVSTSFPGFVETANQVQMNMRQA